MTVKTTEVRSTAARARAEASFKKEERAKDGALAMMEYLANAKMVRATVKSQALVAKG